MKILCWNVRGLGNPRVIRALRHEIKNGNPQIIFLSETKCDQKKVEAVKSVLKFECSFSVPSVGTSGGMLLFWNSDTDISITSYSKGHIDTIIKDKNCTWRFEAGIYSPVGNSRNITIDQDPWINRPCGKLPLFTLDPLKGSPVANLIRGDGLWNEALIRDLFWPTDAEDILNIPLNSSPSEDEIIWAPEKKGSFSVKSPYHLAQNIKTASKDSSLDASNLKDTWKYFWNIKIIPRAKICVWKILNDISPSKTNLNKKGMDIIPLCDLCKSKEESTTHVVWLCKFSKEIWSKFIPNSICFLNMCRPNWKPIDIWQGLLNTLSEEEKKTTIIIIWNLWQFRNRVVLEKSSADQTNLCRLIEASLKDHSEIDAEMLTRTSKARRTLRVTSIGAPLLLRT